MHLGKFGVTTSLTKSGLRPEKLATWDCSKVCPYTLPAKRLRTNKLIDTLCLQKGWEQTKKPIHSACRIFWIPLIDQGTSCNPNSPYTLCAWIQTAHMPWISHILAITIQMPTVTMLRHMHSIIFAAKTFIFWLVSGNWHFVCNWRLSNWQLSNWQLACNLVHLLLKTLVLPAQLLTFLFCFLVFTFQWLNLLLKLLYHQIAQVSCLSTRLLLQ